jgi:hypothetical protein
MPTADREAAARAAAESVESVSWEESGNQVERILLELVNPATRVEAAA